MSIDWDKARRELEVEGAVVFACKRGPKEKKAAQVADGLPSEPPPIARPGQSLFTKVPPHPSKSK